jgi:nicotinamidase-related amidase
MRSTLCIVDMQPKFPASDHILSQVIWKVEEAKKNKWYIVVLEYHNYGRTNAALRNILRGYKRKVYITKYDDDGSSEFAEAAHRNKFSLKNVIVMGVNRGWCVRDTIAGLIDHGKINSILIAKDATWGNRPDIELQSLEYLVTQYPNKVKFI